MKVTAIIENESYNPDILCQYGLSLFVETNGHGFVLDTGADDSALKNYNKIIKSTDKIDAIIISHNHSDHIGGLQYFVDATQDNIPIFISSAVDEVLYTKRFLKKKKLVSRNNLILNNKSRINFVEDKLQIFDNVYVCRIQNPDSQFLCKDKKLKQMQDGVLISDKFLHEIYVAVIEDGECKILSSCSHNGIVNIVNDAKRRFPESVVSCFIGGLHFRGKKKNQLNCKIDYMNKVFEKVNNFDIKIFTCHCTGQKAFEIMKTISNSNPKYFSSGESFDA